MDLLTSHRHSICSDCHRLGAMFGVFFPDLISACYSAGTFAWPCSPQQAAPKVLLSASPAREETDSKITLVHAILSLPSRASTDEGFWGSVRDLQSCREARHFTNPLSASPGRTNLSFQDGSAGMSWRTNSTRDTLWQCRATHPGTVWAYSAVERVQSTNTPQQDSGPAAKLK